LSMLSRRSTILELIGVSLSKLALGFATNWTIALSLGLTGRVTKQLTI
jgi:hypothetical protein